MRASIEIFSEFWLYNSIGRVMPAIITREYIYIYIYIYIYLYIFIIHIEIQIHACNKSTYAQLWPHPNMVIL